jgi:hypothetical protein
MTIISVNRAKRQFEKQAGFGAGATDRTGKPGRAFVGTPGYAGRPCRRLDAGLLALTAGRGQVHCLGTRLRVATGADVPQALPTDTLE